jgi:hypothetical protein
LQKAVSMTTLPMKEFAECKMKLGKVKIAMPAK